MTSGDLSLVDTATRSDTGPTDTANPNSISAQNIFQAIATDAPPPQISQRSDHPVARLGIQPQSRMLQTNKFYANLFLGDQTESVFAYPYSVSWSAGRGQSESWGLSISHIDRDQIPPGPIDGADRGEWGSVVAPLGLQSIVLSATELANGTTLATDSLEAFSVNANLHAPGYGTTPLLTFPLVEGMAFVTAVYHRGAPLIQTGLGFENLTYTGSVGNEQTFKYRVRLTEGSTWLIYVTPSDDQYSQNSFTLLSPVAIQGPSGFAGSIQVAKVPLNSEAAEEIYDGAAGAYATGARISGSVVDTTGTYSLDWQRAGRDGQDLLMFALPHHWDSFEYGTMSGLTDVSLFTTTKGMAMAVRGDSWTLIEPNLPIDMSFNPWSPEHGDIDTLSPSAMEAINAAASIELTESIANQSSLGSMYYDGKALAKFAGIAYAVHELAGNITLALTGLQELQTAFAQHVENQKAFPLVYDTQWGGAVSSGTYTTGNEGVDFGNSLYNDHHFHFGYFLYTAAVIGYLDPGWLDEGTNKVWVNMLARDYANPIEDDPYYPFSRSFDWFMGHSWAKGLFASADGKDQESSSEDTMASYALKMWGRVINDKNMEARGNLMLAIQARSLQAYHLYTDDNAVQPAEFIGNKVAGIMFDNKIDHTTYFGNNIEFIQGINMLPLLPSSTLIRTKTFVDEEWRAYDFGTYVGSVQSGWRGVLMANLAIIDPVASYGFFSNSSGDFHLELLDGGASQTWYLAWSAALGGSDPPSGGGNYSMSRVSMADPARDTNVHSTGRRVRRRNAAALARRRQPGGQGGGEEGQGGRT